MRVPNALVKAFVRRRAVPGDGLSTSVEHVSVTDFRDVRPFLYWASDRTSVRFCLDPDTVRTRGCFSLGNGWHPFIAAIKEGTRVLQHFYARFQPRDVYELYFLESLRAEEGSALGPGTLPWLRVDDSIYKRRTFFHGPAGARDVAAEMGRLRALARSIDRSGYRPDVYGDVTGYFLSRGREFRFLVKGGTHRAAVACGLGLQTLPVMFKPNWPRVIDLNDIENWPLVASGAVSRQLAEAIFSRYFDFDGSQQFARFQAPAEALPPEPPSPQGKPREDSSTESPSGGGRLRTKP